ncbi:hypothetical protein HMPREF9566_00890 [Cutibacterium acnes HL045PA1]|nr:hypothetical protein HMPREF9566_00890 [Cutibacterium acnes HL045PA1]EGE96443.1 hypothetical protein HMPREF9571_00355 [Cutibacterium acnes HL043PA2]
MRWTIGASRPQAVEVAGSGSGSHRSEEKGQRREIDGPCSVPCRTWTADRNGAEIS